MKGIRSTTTSSGEALLAELNIRAHLKKEVRPDGSRLRCGRRVRGRKSADSFQALVRQRLLEAECTKEEREREVGIDAGHPTRHEAHSEPCCCPCEAHPESTANASQQRRLGKNRETANHGVRRVPWAR